MSITTMGFSGRHIVSTERKRALLRFKPLAAIGMGFECALVEALRNDPRNRRMHAVLQLQALSNRSSPPPFGLTLELSFNHRLEQSNKFERPATKRRYVELLF